MDELNHAIVVPRSDSPDAMDPCKAYKGFRNV